MKDLSRHIAKLSNLYGGLKIYLDAIFKAVDEFCNRNDGAVFIGHIEAEGKTDLFGDGQIEVRIVAHSVAEIFNASVITGLVIHNGIQFGGRSDLPTKDKIGRDLEKPNNLNAIIDGTSPFFILEHGAHADNKGRFLRFFEFVAQDTPEKVAVR
jgi:hypothetical protein